MALEIFQTKENVEKVRIKFNNSVSTRRINGRISLMKTDEIMFKIVELKVMKPHKHKKMKKISI
jgi:hypothetical protein